MTPLDPVDLMRFMIEQGYDTVRVEPDGRLVCSLPTAAGGSQIIRGDLLNVEDRWSYPTRDAALVAVLRWSASGAAEPEGWIRHQPSNRRRVYAADGSYLEVVRE